MTSDLTPEFIINSQNEMIELILREIKLRAINSRNRGFDRDTQMIIKEFRKTLKNIDPIIFNYALEKVDKEIIS